jgi:hypothetical protein
MPIKDQRTRIDEMGATVLLGAATAFSIRLFAIPWYVKCQAALNEYRAAKGRLRISEKYRGGRLCAVHERAARSLRTTPAARTERRVPARVRPRSRDRSHARGAPRRRAGRHRAGDDFGILRQMIRGRALALVRSLRSTRGSAVSAFRSSPCCGARPRRQVKPNADYGGLWPAANGSCCARRAYRRLAPRAWPHRRGPTSVSDGGWRTGLPRRGLA